MFYNTIQYNTIQYNTIQYNTIQYNTIQYNTIQYNTIQYNTIQYNTIQYNTIQYNFISLSEHIYLHIFNLNRERELATRNNHKGLKMPGGQLSEIFREYINDYKRKVTNNTYR